MSPGDDAEISPRIPSIDNNSSFVNKEKVWKNMPSEQKETDIGWKVTNGHAKNGNANGYKNGNAETINGNGGRRDSTHAWSPLLQKEPTAVDETDINNSSNNNEWKESEDINNLRNNIHKSHGNNNGSLMNGKNGFGVDKVAEQDPLTGFLKQQDDDDSSNCCFGGCRPKWGRVFASTHMFMVVFLLAWVLQGMFYTYFVSSITTIEKLFQIKSKTTGMLMSATEIGQISAALLLTYYAGRGHRPRWIALGMVLFAISLFGCSMPHFIFGKRLLQSNSLLKGSIETTPNLCLPHGNFSSELECAEQVELDQASHSQITLIVLCIFFLSLLTAGIGQTAVATLGIPYIDDNVASRESPIYIAITIGVRILGPAAGFMVGSYTTGVYIDLTDPGIGPSDPKWVGAWWLGLVGIATLMIVTSIAMFMFPKHLRGNRIPPPAKVRAIEEQRKVQQEDVRPRLKDFPKTIRRLLKNDILMFRTASSVFHLLPVAGLYTFLPKYMETQFRLTASNVNLIVAVGGILVMGVGIVISGVVILKCNPTARSVAAWIAFTAMVYACGMATLTFVGCNLDDFAGPRVNETNALIPFERSCNVSCSCDFQKFSPICGSDGKTYYSSCHAGCSLSEMSDGKRVFSGCECIPNIPDELHAFDAQSGYCDDNCKNFVLFISLFAFFVFMHSTSEVGSILLIIRCTDPKDKAMAMGIIQSAIGLFGNVPCPIIYGAIVDSTCLVWDTVCGVQGACSLYDPDSFRNFFLGVTAGIMLLAFFMDLVVWHKADRIDIDPNSSSSESELEKPISVPESSV